MINKNGFIIKLKDQDTYLDSEGAHTQDIDQAQVWVDDMAADRMETWFTEKHRVEYEVKRVRYTLKLL